MTRLLFVLFVVMSWHSAAQAGNWPAFRGPDGNGISTEQGVPTTWGESNNIVWKIPLAEPNNSSPIVWEDRIFLAEASKGGGERRLLCLDRATGKERWRQVVPFTGEDPTHGTNPHGSATPVTDGERVIVWHSSGGLHCYDLDGKPQWSRDLGQFQHIWGYGASPVIHGSRVLLNAGPGKRQFLIALDKASGSTLWQVDEPGGDSGLKEDGGRAEWTGSWSTPLVTKIDGVEQVVVSYPKHVQGYDLASGKVLWEVGGLGPLVYTDPLIGDGFGVAMSGYHGPAIGYKLGGSGDTTETHRLWVQPRPNPQRIGSGVILNRHLFMANEQGIFQSIDLQTGEERWKERLAGPRIWGSMIAAEGRLYVTNGGATTFVLAANADKFELLAKNDLPGEQTNSTIALSNGQVFLRTFKHLYCIAKQK